LNPNVPSIEQLKELALPASVSYAPQTWGWWVLVGVLILLTLIIAIRRYRQWRRDAYRREGLERLAQLRSRSEELYALRELPELLKRVALSMPTQSPSWNPVNVGASLLAKRPAHSTSMVSGPPPSRAGSLPQGPAALGREDWQSFLQRHSKKQLPSDLSTQLAQLAYAPDDVLRALPAPQRQALFDTCQHWVEHHHVAA
jgi:uncharacterized membrane protein YecN with MAPEG domain